MNIKTALKILNFATVVFRRDFGLLKISPQVFVPMPEILDHFVALFGAKAVFHSAPFPLNLIGQRIWLRIHHKLAWLQLLLLISSGSRSTLF